MKSTRQNEIFQPDLQQKSLVGTVERITFFNEENNYVVAQMRLENAAAARVTIVGIMPAIAEGERIQVEGEWRKHPRFGLQFQVTGYQSLPHITREGVERYLGSGLIKGIGPHFAKKIVKKFGMDTLHILENEPERLKEVEGIGKKRLTMILEAWETQKDIKDIMMFLAEHAVSTTFAVKIYRHYGADTLKILRQNPYRMADDIFGIGFLTADKIAKQLGIADDEEARLEAGIRYALTQATEEGHVFLPREELLNKSAELLTVARPLVEAVYHQLVKMGQLIEEDDAVYLPIFYRAEIELATRLASLARDPRRIAGRQSILKEMAPQLKLGDIQFSAKQLAAMQAAMREHVLVITGGPGTGKTTLVKGLIQVFKYLGKKIALTAPTGRAAKRLEETTGMPARTIHRLLEFEPQTRQFKRHPDNPLPVDVVIVDEVSMVDCFLAQSLVRALPHGARLILVGDVDQLPPVGPGNVLRDIIDSGKITTVHLDEIFRQAAGSAIVLNAHRVNQGQMPAFTRKQPSPSSGPSVRKTRLLPRDDYGDFLFVQEEDPERAVALILDLCAKKLPERYGYNPRTDIQVITPMYRGDLGADNLNRVLQERLNPGKPGVSRGKTEFRVGDRVMQIRNNYDKGVFNGDLGLIRQIDLEEQRLAIQFDNLLMYDFADLDEITLAYAITVHKSQGSEYPVVIMPIVTQHYMMLQRNLLYTAMTRARELMILIGTKKALSLAVRNQRVTERYTRLAQRLRQAIEVLEQHKKNGSNRLKES